MKIRKNSTSQNIRKYFEENTIRCEISYRGGGIEIDLSEATGIDGLRITAYQNYLGGGIAGSIQSDCNYEDHAIPEAKKELIEKLREELTRYFYSLNNGGGDDYMQGLEDNTYEKNQSMPSGAY